MSAATMSKNTSAPSLLNGLLAWWGCHEGAGIDRADASGNSKPLSENAATVNNIDGLIGKAAVFTGTSTRYLTRGALVASGSFTFACWLFPNSLATTTNPMSQAAATGIRFTVTSTSIFWSFSSGSITFAVPLVARTWSHLCGTHDGTTARLYVNGVLSATSTPTVSYAGPQFALGCRSDGSAGTGFNGYIQLAGVWSRALTDGAASVGQSALGEVAALYQNGQGVDYPFAAAA